MDIVDISDVSWDRHSYQKYLDCLMQIVQERRKSQASDVDRRWWDGLERGLTLAMNALAEWEKQDSPTTLSEGCEGPMGGIDQDGNPLDYCDP